MLDPGKCRSNRKHPAYVKNFGQNQYRHADFPFCRHATGKQNQRANTIISRRTCATIARPPAASIPSPDAIPRIPKAANKAAGMSVPVDAEKAKHAGVAANAMAAATACE